MHQTTLTGKKDFLRMAARQMLKSPTRHEKILQDRLNLICPLLFKSQWVIDDFIADFYSPLLNIAIEVDGSSHNSTLGRANDAVKELAFSKRKIQILRFTNKQIDNDLEAVCREVIKAIAPMQCSKATLRKWGYTFTKKERKAVKELLQLEQT